MAVADEAGLAGLAMASVAARLGCTKMALYRYVDAKEDLHTLMLDAALGPAPELPAEDWRAAAAAWADAMLVRLAAHPWAVDLPIGSALLTRNQTWWLEVLLRALRPSGLTLPERLSVTLLLSSHALATARMRRDRGAAGDGTTEPAAAFAALAAAPAASGLEEVPAAFAAVLSGRIGSMSGRTVIQSRSRRGSQSISTRRGSATVRNYPDASARPVSACGSVTRYQRTPAWDRTQRHRRCAAAPGG